MQFSFIISAAPGNAERVGKIIDSIEEQEIDNANYEVIIVGHDYKYFSRRKCTTVIDFDESIRPAWITRKKNLGAERAKFDNLVLLHDYIVLDKDWYKGFSSWQSEWQLAITPLVTIDGIRWRDFTTFPPYTVTESPLFNERAFLPYDFIVTPAANKYMYVSGSYYIVKRELARAFPLDESLAWGQGEDLEWYRRLANAGIIVRCNPNSVARFIKNVGEVPSWHQVILDQEIEFLCNLK